jgi:hypothetical protein
MAPDAAEEETLANGHVARALFTTLVADREPQDDVSELTNENVNVMFFTDLRDLQGQTVSHVWKRDGNVMARVPFAVQGPRWRVYSTKNLEPSWTGTWTVTVVDANGQELHSDSFSYVATATAAEPAEETAPPAAMPME